MTNYPFLLFNQTPERGADPAFVTDGSWRGVGDGPSFAWQANSVTQDVRFQYRVIDIREVYAAGHLLTFTAGDQRRRHAESRTASRPPSLATEIDSGAGLPNRAA